MNGTGQGGAGRGFAGHWLTVQPYLFGFLEDEVGELDESLRLFVQAAESADIGIVAERYGWCGNGRKPSDRLAIFKLFLMKHVLNLPTPTPNGRNTDSARVLQLPHNYSIAFPTCIASTNFKKGRQLQNLGRDKRDPPITV